MAGCIGVRVVTLSDCPPECDSARFELGNRSNLNSPDTGIRVIDPTVSMKPKTLPLVLLAALIARSHAESFVWSGAGADPNWSTAGNWSVGGNPAVAGPATGDDILFYAAEAQLSNTLSAPFSINQLAFAATATSAVTITGDATNFLALGAGGLVVPVGNHKFTGANATTGTAYDWRFSASTNLQVAAGASFDINGRIGHLASGQTQQKTGAGTLILSGSNGASGGWNTAFEVSEGVVRLAGSNAYGLSGNRWTVSNGAALEVQGNQTVNNGVISLSGSGIGGAGALRTLDGTRSITGSSTTGGGISLAADSSIGVDSGTLSIAPVIFGANALTKVGAGTLTLSGINTYTGDTRIAAGILRLGNANALAVSTVNLATGDAGELSFGTLTAATIGGLSGTRALVAENTNAAAVTLTVGANAADTSHSGNISGAGTLRKTGAGTLTLSGDNSFGAGGILTVGASTADNAGALRLASPTAHGGVSTIHLGGGSTTGVSRLELIGGHVFEAAEITTLGRPNAPTVGAALVNVSGNNTWQGNVTITAGGGSYVVRSDAGTLTLTGGLRNNLAATARTWDVYGAGDTIVQGAIGEDAGAGALTLRKYGSGTLTLTGTNTYQGPTTVGTGTLAVASAGSINSTSSITVSPGASFVYNSSTALSVAPVLAGNTAANRAVLGGAGPINATLTLDNVGDTLSPGNSPGIQTFTPDQNWNSFSYDWEVKDFTGTTAGTDFDRISVTGALSLAGGSGSYILNLFSLTALDTAGDVANFSEIDRSWTVLTTGTGITGFDAANWTINPGAFNNNETGSFSLGLGAGGNDLVLIYTPVPEPAAALLGGLGLLALLRRRRESTNFRS
jgi:MYXO-CTERM domain-containing protein